MDQLVMRLASGVQVMRYYFRLSNLHFYTVTVSHQEQEEISIKLYVNLLYITLGPP